MLRKILKGLSWGEIAVSLLIFLLIAIFTVPSYSQFKCLARQSEAKFEIRRVVAAAELFKSEFHYVPTIEELVLENRIKIRQKFYDYEIPKSDGDSIVVVANGKVGSEMESDQWWGDSHKKLENVQNACAR